MHIFLYFVYFIMYYSTGSIYVLYSTHIQQLKGALMTPPPSFFLNKYISI